MSTGATAKAALILNTRTHNAFALTEALALAAHKVLQELPGDMECNDLYCERVPEWAEFRKGLTRVQRGALTRAFCSISVRMHHCCGRSTAYVGAAHRLEGPKGNCGFSNSLFPGELAKLRCSL